MRCVPVLELHPLKDVVYGGVAFTDLKDHYGTVCSVEDFLFNVTGCSSCLATCSS